MCVTLPIRGSQLTVNLCRVLVDEAAAALLNKMIHDRLEQVRGEVEVDVSKQQENPQSPLFSIKSFDELRL